MIFVFLVQLSGSIFLTECFFQFYENIEEGLWKYKGILNHNVRIHIFSVCLYFIIINTQPKVFLYVLAKSVFEFDAIIAQR